MKKPSFKCYYGISSLEPSNLNEYRRCEASQIEVSHINESTTKGNVCIWLKTFGLKSFMIECSFDSLPDVIRSLNLKSKGSAYSSAYSVPTMFQMGLTSMEQVRRDSRLTGGQRNDILEWFQL